jgi:hypothetical protein
VNIVEIAIGTLVAVIGCFIGLAGWISKRDNKIDSDGKWKGGVDVKLNNIQSGVSGVNDRMNRMEGKFEEHEKRITRVETTIGIGKEKSS